MPNDQVDPQDARAICEWMEPRKGKRLYGNVSPFGWWKLDLGEWIPNHTINSLDRLREVESGLTEEQQLKYDMSLRRILNLRSQWMWHASASEKAEALARVIKEKR